MRVRKESHFDRKPVIQQHVFHGNTGICKICGQTRGRINDHQLKCLQTKSTR